MSNTPSQRVGRNVERLRIAANLSLRELAPKVDLDYSALSKLENGKRRVTVDELEALAMALDVPATMLLADPPHPGGEIGGLLAEYEAKREEFEEFRTGVRRNVVEEERKLLNLKLRTEERLKAMQGEIDGLEAQIGALVEENPEAKRFTRALADVRKATK